MQKFWQLSIPILVRVYTSRKRRGAREINTMIRRVKDVSEKIEHRLKEVENGRSPSIRLFITNLILQLGVKQRE